MCKFADIFVTKTGHFGHFNSTNFRPTCHPEFISANLRTDVSPDSENIELIRTVGSKTRLFERGANSRQGLTGI